MAKNILLFAILFIGLMPFSYAQNVGINGAGTAPNASAMLDIESTTRGLLIPRIALTANNVAAPVTSPLTSLLIYNTATASSGSTAVSPGYYYWDGARWVALAGPNGRDWSLTGNSGTTPPSVGYGSNVDNNFLGTTDAQDLTFATNNLERMRIKTDNGSQLRIGMGTAFTVNLNAGSTPSLLHLHDWGTTANDFAILNLSSQTTASGNRTGIINFAATSATNERRAAAIESYLTAASGTNVSGDLRFFTNNANTFAERMRIFSDGRVAVNSTATFPSSTFFAAGTGNNNAVDGSVAGTGSAIYGQNTGTGFGIYGLTNNNTGIGVFAQNLGATGTGLLVAGNNSPAYTLASNGSGLASNGIPIGLVTYGNNAAAGWGIVSAGNDLTTGTIAGGGGGSFNGRQWGVYANAAISGAGNNGTDRAAFVGNFVSVGTTVSTVYVGARIGGTIYKILGPGGASVSTTMLTKYGERVLFAPESPENWFFDINEVQLVNGKAIVLLDPIFVECLSDSKPFKVFVQGAENTLGNIRITRNQNEKSFLVEDLGGASNGTVQYSIYGIWKGKENLRFPEFSEENRKELIPQEKKLVTSQKTTFEQKISE